MAVDLDLPLSAIMAGPTAMLVVMGIISWPLGNMLERYGARPIMTLGSPVGAAGLLIMSAATGPVTYFLSWVVLGCAGACMLTTPAQIAVTEVAGEKSRQTLSVLIIVGGLTSTIMWPLTAVLRAQWGWRTTTMVYAALLLIVCMPLHWFALARRRRSPAKDDVTPTRLSIDSARFVLLATSFAANGFVTWGFALTIIILFEVKGLDHATALTAAAFIGVAQWAGRMVDFFIGGRWSDPRLAWWARLCSR
ncbi:MFS transporter [Bradyrhizobium sp. NBAIM08]|uniref:MFS transporter n=1 Tax=Bradyrhizobium sp. NBAIM08 TaxID=2793815 RepID=UPI00201CAA0E|nr:MFS transporter [Bradyrhizobium sp. NBAIM08]